MNVLIVGGTGLISTPITRALLERGDTVTLLNRGRASREFVGQAGQIVCDRRDSADFERLIAEAGRFDCAIDMVCFTRDEAESAVRALAGRCEQFVLCSTVDVYARPTMQYPYREGDALSALSEYGRGKIACERVLEQAHADGAFQLTVLRPAHTYCDTGTIVHSMGWSPALLDRIRRGKPLIVHGDGQSLWTSAHAEDVAAGFVGALGNTRAYGRAYHLVGEEWLTWNAYHQVVADALGAPLPELVHVPTDLLSRVAPRSAVVCWANFQYCNIFDSSAARSDLGYAQRITVRRGFERVVRRLEADGAIPDSDGEPGYDAVIEAWRELCRAMETRLEPLGL